MKKFRIDKETIWEETGIIKIHNFPPSNRTYSWITREYREYKQGLFGHKLVEGPAIQLHSLPQKDKELAHILGIAQNSLMRELPELEGCEEIKES